MNVNVSKPFLTSFFSSFAIVSVYIAILAHAVGVKLIMRAVPGFFGSSILVVAIVAHTLGIMFTFLVPAVVNFFSV